MASRYCHLPKKTAAADTAFADFVPPKAGHYASLLKFVYRAAGTEHTVTWMRPLARTTVTTAISAAGTAGILRRDPGAYAANFSTDQVGFVPVAADNVVAANDWLLIAGVKGSGRWHLTQVSGAPTVNGDGTVSFTLGTAAPTGGIPAGAVAFFFGTTTDSHPKDGRAHPQFAGVASTTKEFVAEGRPVVEPYDVGEPLLYHSNNATAAGVMDYAVVEYTSPVVA